MKTVYLDKKERVFAWFTPARAALLGVVVLVLLFVAVVARVRRRPLRAGAGAQNPGPHRGARNRGGSPRR